MKRLVCATGIILIGCLLLGAFFSTPDAALQTSDTVSSTESVTEQVYVIKIEDGYLAVYEKGKAEPYIKTETLAANLPKSDALRLEQGIEVTGQSQLKRALEDYCS